MPKKAYIKTLKHLCVCNVAQNMDYWCEDYTKNFLDQGNFLFLLGPFDVLTADLIQDLINVLCEKKLMKRHYLNILLDIVVDSLDLSGCRNIANRDAVIALISTRCQKMRKLNLSTMNAVSIRCLHDLICTLPFITTLNLKQTKCDDQVLTVIGRFSHKLQDLNISGCPVSDTGMINLCVSFDSQLKKCQNLVKLDITNTIITSKGVRCAIENLDNIKILFYPDLCEVLYEMYAKNEENGVKKVPLHLRWLSIQQMKALSAPVLPSIEVSCNYCPFITEVYFLRGVNSAGVVALSLLKHIKVLHLANCEEQLISFESGILPLLQSCGATVEELNLSEINQLDVGCIGACCKNLKKFTCLISSYDMAEFPVHSHPEIISSRIKSFLKLEECKILLHTSDNNFPDTYLKLITINARQLRKFHLAMVNVLTDSLFDEIMEVNPLYNLEELILESCPHITGEAIWKILETKNDLSVLSLLYCMEITRVDFEEYQKYCKQNHFNVKIEWM